VTLRLGLVAAHRTNTSRWNEGFGWIEHRGRSYQLSVPLPVPAKLFWSITVYDAETRSEIVTEQSRAALRSLVELTAERLGDRATEVTLHFGPNPPEGTQGRWIKTTPDRGWFVYFRIYGPDAPAFDGSWRLPDFQAVD